MNLRKEAKGRECQARIPNICNRNPETTVLCHTNNLPLVGAGVGLKPNDVFAFWGCSACHDLLDKRNRATVFGDWQLEIWEYEAILRTQKILIDEGKLWTS